MNPTIVIIATLTFGFIVLVFYVFRLVTNLGHARRKQFEAELTAKKWCKEIMRREKELIDIEAITRHKLKTEYDENLQKEMAEKVETLRRKFTKENAHLMAQALCAPRCVELKNKMNEVLEAQFKRMSQEFIGQLTDDSDAVKEELMTEIGDRIWDRLQQIKENFKDSPYILPQDCKLAYTKGNRTVVVIEQKPQVRSIVFTPKLVSDKDAEQSTGRTSNGYRFTLAFPHVMFFIVFDKGRYAYHEIYFRNKPLLSTREHVYLAPIPNIFRDRGKHFKPMCMGEQFSVDKGDTIARQCEYAVGVFWQSTFNEHLGDGGGGKIDKRIKNWRTWQDNTKEDPLFVLKIQWKQGRTAKGVIESILKMRDHKHELDGMDKDIKNQIDSGIGRIASSVKEGVSVVKNHKLKKKDIDEFLRESVETLLIGHSDEVFQRCTDTN